MSVRFRSRIFRNISDLSLLKLLDIRPNQKRYGTRNQHLKQHNTVFGSLCSNCLSPRSENSAQNRDRQMKAGLVIWKEKKHLRKHVYGYRYKETNVTLAERNERRLHHSNVASKLPTGVTYRDTLPCATGHCNS